MPWCCRAGVGMFPKSATTPASFQVILAVGGSSSYACYVYGTVPLASQLVTYLAPGAGLSQSGVPPRVRLHTLRQVS